MVVLAFWMAADPLNFKFFVKRVEPIFLKPREGAARCYNCHSFDSNKALFHLEPLGAGGAWTKEQSRRNFESVLKVIDLAQPLKSRLLLHPLAEEAGGDPFHTGGKFWKSKEDPEWRILAQWARGRALRNARSR